MAAGTLTEDQRWLLRSVGGHEMLGCLADADGWEHLMQSMYQGSGRCTEGGPEWLRGGFRCRNGRIASPEFGDAVVTVTKVQLARYVLQLPGGLVDEMRACRAATTANAVLRGRFCHCGSTPCGYAYMRDRICPPTEQQETDAGAEYWRVHDWTDELLDRALGFDVATEPVGQLELFGATA